LYVWLVFLSATMTRGKEEEEEEEERSVLFVCHSSYIPSCE